MEEYMRNHMSNDILEEAAVLYDCAIETFKDLGGFENFVYEFTKNNQYYIIRFVHSGHRSYDLVQAEIEFIDYLDYNHACVSKVVHSINQAIVEKITIDKQYYFSIAVFEKAKGTHVQKSDLTPGFYRMFGEKVGQLHRLTKTFKPQHKRIQWFDENILDIGERALDQEDYPILTMYIEVVKRIKQLSTNINNYGLIHTDLHFGNMYFDQEKLTFFDFDDSSYKHFLSDIAIIIYYSFMFENASQTEYNQKVKEFLSDFLIGYQKENDFDLDFFVNINDFILLRSLVLYIVVIGSGYKISDDPQKIKFAKLVREAIFDNSKKLDVDFLLDGLK